MCIIKRFGATSTSFLCVEYTFLLCTDHVFCFNFLYSSGYPLSLRCGRLYHEGMMKDYSSASLYSANQLYSRYSTCLNPRVHIHCCICWGLSCSCLFWRDKDTVSTLFARFLFYLLARFSC